MMRILAYIHDIDLLKDLMELTHNEAWIQTTALSALPRNTEWIRALQIDVLLLDCTQDQETALAFARMIRSDEQLSLRIVYMIEQHPMKPITASAAQSDDVFLYAPFSIGKMMMKLVKNEVHSHSGMSYFNDEAMVSQLIQNMGIPVHLNGFRYIKTAVIYLLHENHQGLLMHQLYKEIARIHTTTASRVEKAIRDAIDYAYRIDPTHIQIQQRKPTNSQLIHLTYERMRQKQREAQEKRKAEV